MTEASRSALAQLRNIRTKIVWGVRVAGLPAAARGAGRIAALRLQRPSRSRVQVRSGFELEFAYPTQVPVALLAFGDLIDPEYPFLTAVSSPDWVVADVGAAIGQFTVFAARLPVAEVHSFEPSKENLDSLRRNAEINNVADRVVIHSCALSDHEGRQSFATSGPTWVSGLGTENVDDDNPQVEVRRLDSEFERLSISRVNVLKVNVAGDEPRVLAGARGVLSRGAADVLVLLLGIDSFPLYSELSTQGYRFFFFHPRRGELHEVTRFDSSLLDRRPWPARHIIGLHKSAMDAGLAGQFRVCRDG